MIQTTDDIINAMEQDREAVISTMLQKLIIEHRNGDGHRLTNLWKRYRLKDPPIKKRKKAEYEKVDRRMAHDFYADIVDTKTGYMGNEISIVVDKNAYDNDAQLAVVSDAIRQFTRANNSEDLNSEMVRDAAATGIGYRLLYVPAGENAVRMKNLPADEVIYIYDQSIDSPQLVLRYYELPADNGKIYTAVEWYDDTEIRYYLDDTALQFRLDTSRGAEGRQPHMFSGIPIIPFENNREQAAEPEKVLDLIDGYDAIVSSTASEIEQLRLAYMYVKGAGRNVDAEFVRDLEKTGIFGLDENGEVGFVNKQLAIEVVKEMLAEIRRNIYQFSHSIDMSQNFGGEMRVIGWQVALLGLENSAKITERKFTKAMRRQYEMVSEYWRTYQGLDVDPMGIQFEYTRNFPRDIQSEAETLQLLLGTVSTRTAFSQMSFIDDVDEEMERVAEESSPFDMGEDNADAE